MSTGLYVFLSCLLSFGVPAGLAVRELILLSHERRGDDGKRRVRERAPAPLPADGDLPPLPECLIPRRPAQPVGDRPRVLEPV